MVCQLVVVLACLACRCNGRTLYIESDISSIARSKDEGSCGRVTPQNMFTRFVLAFGSPCTGSKIIGHTKSHSRTARVVAVSKARSEKTLQAPGSAIFRTDIRRKHDIDIEIEIARQSKAKMLRSSLATRVLGVPVLPVLGNVLGCVLGVPMLNVLSGLMNLRILTRENGMRDLRLDKEDLRNAVSALRQAKKDELLQASLVQQSARPMADAYAAAEIALSDGDEAGARNLLEKWQELKETKKVAEVELRLASQVVESMQKTLAESMRQLLEEPGRGMDLDQLLLICSSDPGEEVALRLCVRHVNAKKETADASEVDLEDPLERKFRELEFE